MHASGGGGELTRGVSIPVTARGGRGSDELVPTSSHRVDSFDDVYDDSEAARLTPTTSRPVEQNTKTDAVYFLINGRFFFTAFSPKQVHFEGFWLKEWPFNVKLAVGLAARLQPCSSCWSSSRL